MVGCGSFGEAFAPYRPATVAAAKGEFPTQTRPFGCSETMLGAAIKCRLGEAADHDSVQSSNICY